MTQVQQAGQGLTVFCVRLCVRETAHYGVGEGSPGADFQRLRTLVCIRGPLPAAAGGLDELLWQFHRLYCSYGHFIERRKEFV